MPLGEILSIVTTLLSGLIDVVLVLFLRQKDRKPDVAPPMSRGDEAQAIEGTTTMYGLSRSALAIIVIVFLVTVAIVSAIWLTDFFGIGGGDDQITEEMAPPESPMEPTSPVDQHPEQDGPNDELGGDPTDEKDGTGSGLEVAKRLPLEAIDGTQIEDGALIKREGSEELYVVKILRNQWYKRLFLKWEQLAVYPNLTTAPQLRVSDDLFQAFTTSCIIEIDKSMPVEFWFLEAKENSDIGARHQIIASPEELIATGIAEGAIFLSVQEELDFFGEMEPWTVSGASMANAKCGE